MNKDLISIILPVYNGERTILRSIRSALDQTYQNFELIIIDDGSSDNTSEIIQELDDQKIVYIKNQKNLGLIKSLNIGLDKAKGEFIARIDCDDVWVCKDKLEKQINFLNANKEYVLVGTFANFIYKNKIVKKRPETEDGKIRKNLLIRNQFIHSSVMFRKTEDRYLKDEYVEDYGLWMRLGTKGKFANLEYFCVDYFISLDGHTQSALLKQTYESFKIIDRYKRYYPNYFFGKVVWGLKIIFLPILNLYRR